MPPARKSTPRGGGRTGRQRPSGVAISDGLEANADDVPLLTFDPNKPTSIIPDQVVVDRDQLRELRMSEAAKTVADMAKGDDTLTEIHRHKGGSKHIVMINPYDLHFEDRHNPRDFTTPQMRWRVASYADSIAERGVRVPLDTYVKANRVLVNNGDTRWRATLHAINFLNAPIKAIQCIITQGENDADRKISQWIGNDTYRFDPLAEAQLFRDFLDLGGEIGVFAKRIGHPVSYIISRVRLLEMPKWLLEKVQDGTVPHRTAYDKIWLASGEQQTVARELLAASLITAKAEQTERGVDATQTVVRPRHVNAAAEHSEVSTKIVRTKFPDRLAPILKQRTRDEWVEFLGAEMAEAIFKLARIQREPDDPTSH